ncbi:MAG: hypothetical protein QY332_15210 [Anaerolineales bacterium]|nr:MAG: hypothetical protein QY332_15210 [Anaerolineales bacterium]
MAKVKLNPIVEQLRGQIGDLVFRRAFGKVVVGRKAAPDERDPSPAQLEVRERFRAAALYGRMALADPAARQLYEDAAGKKGKPVFSMVMADFLNAPSIEEIDVSEYSGAQGSPIYIRTEDDFQIERVDVGIADTDGAELEAGPAALEADSGRWVYRAAQNIPAGTNVRITVTATDRPGGAAVMNTGKAL